MKKEIDRILSDFYYHATGSADYGCKECKKHRNKLLKLLKADYGEILDVMELEAVNNKRRYPTYKEMAIAIAKHYNQKGKQ